MDKLIKFIKSKIDKKIKYFIESLLSLFYL